MKVINERILIKVLKEDTVQSTGSKLTIPDTMKLEGIEKATIIKVQGDNDPDEIVGKLCLIYAGSGKEFTNPDDHVKYRVVSKSEVIVVLD